MWRSRISISQLQQQRYHLRPCWPSDYVTTQFCRRRRVRRVNGIFLCRVGGLIVNSRRRRCHPKFSHCRPECSGIFLVAVRIDALVLSGGKMRTARNQCKQSSLPDLKLTCFIKPFNDRLLLPFLGTTFTYSAIIFWANWIFALLVLFSRFLAADLADYTRQFYNAC